MAWPLSVAAALWLSAAPVRYDGDRLVEVAPRDASERARVLEVVDDVWTHRPGPGPFTARVAAGDMAALDALGVDYRVLEHDLQGAVDAERERLREPVLPGEDFFADFRDFTALDAHLDDLAVRGSDLVEVIDVGTSLEGRPIRGLRIAGAYEGTQAAVLLTGTMHAREWITPMVSACLADALVNGYGRDAAITAMLDEVAVIVIPVLNPDGYVWSWDVERYWRKNRRDGVGVDLNRNFPTGWGGDGSSGNPQAEDYRGTAPLSEPESAAFAAFVDAHPEIVTHVDYHSFGQLLLHPWSYIEATAEDRGITVLAQAQSDAIAAVNGEVYQPIPGWLLYVASGVVDDWVYDAHGIYAFAYELPPGLEDPDGFVVPPETILPMCEENLAAVLVLGEWAAQFSEPSQPGTSSGSLDDTGGDSTGAAASSSSGSVPGSTSDSAGTSTTGPALGSSDTSTDSSGTSGTAPAASEESGCACGSSPREGSRATMLVWAFALILRRRRTRRR